jgi:hypothetical protein
VAVFGQRVADDDVADILALDEHVGLADGVGLVVEFLAEHGQAGIGVVFKQIFAGHRQHAARPCRWVIDGAHDGIARRQHIVVLDEQQIDHQADDFARREVLAGGFVGDFGELAYQLFEDQAHLGVIDGVRVQVDVGELFGDQVEQAGLGQALDLGIEIEALEDVAGRRRKALDVGVEVFANMVLVAKQLVQVKRRGVVEALASLAKQERVWVEAGSSLGVEFGQDCRLLLSSTQSRRRRMVKGRMTLPYSDCL